MKTQPAARTARFTAWLALAGSLSATSLAGCGSSGDGADPSTDPNNPFDPNTTTSEGGAGGAAGSGNVGNNVDDLGRVLDWQGTVICDPAVRDCSSFTELAAGYDLATPSFGRLNNTQYNNTVRDLLGTTLTPADAFPGDDLALGFDTIGATLRVQPEHVEKYVPASATLISELFARAPGDPLRDRYLSCDYSAAACQLQILTTFAGKAWRRPALESELNPIVSWMATQVAAGYSADEVMQGAMRFVLLSPNFMYRIELDPNPLDATPHALGAHELASRLSYFLWSTMPDDALLAAADSGALLTDAGLNAEIQRMMGDSTRILELIDQFGLQWLNVYRVLGVTPDAQVFPGFNAELQQAMFEETRLVLSDFLATDQPVKNLLTANFTFVNPTLAQHYGLTAASADGFAKIDTTGSSRIGILTHGSFLVGTSNPTRTSPVKRGRHVLERLLCSPPPDPPANIDTNIDEGSGLENLSLRDRLMAHQQKGPACAGCHVVMDAIGLGLENYDGIGSYRTSDEYGTINPAGEIPAADGTGAKLPFAGVNELAALLASDPRILSCTVEKMLTFGMGRSFGAADHALKQSLAITSDAYGGHLRAVVESIVMSQVFRNRRAAPAAAPVGG